MSGSVRGLPACRGFTLIELLAVALIFSLLALMSYRGLDAVLDAREHVRQETEKWRAVAAFLSRFERDARLATARPGRIGSGKVPAWRGNAAGMPAPVLEFSRLAPLAGTEDSRRLAYALNEKREIELWMWPGLDIAPDTAPLRYPLLAGVNTLELNYLNANLAWVESWPVSGDETSLPRAVRLRVVLVSGEEIVRVIAL